MLKKYGVENYFLLPEFQESVKGENHWNWNPNKGMPYIYGHIWFTPEYLEWKDRVFERDDHKCRICGSDKKIQSHHIFPLRDMPLLAFDVENGITLCKKCHKKTFNKEIDFIDQFLNITMGDRVR